MQRLIFSGAASFSPERLRMIALAVHWFSTVAFNVILAAKFRKLVWVVRHTGALVRLGAWLLNECAQ
jgi:hypothetical protein